MAARLPLLRVVVFGLAWIAARAAGAVELQPGAVVVADRIGASLLQYDPVSGGVDVITSPEVGVGPALELPWDVGLGPDGLLYVADSAGVFRVDPGSGAREVLIPLGLDPDLGVAFRRPVSLAFDAAGFLYVLDTGTSVFNGQWSYNSVVRVDLADGSRELLSKTDAPLEQPRSPRDLAIHLPTGTVFVTDLDDSIKVLDPGDVFRLGSETFSPSAGSLEGISVDRRRNLFVVVRGTGQGIHKAHPIIVVNRLVWIWDPPVSNTDRGSGPPFEVPRDIAIDAQEMLWVADRAGLFRVDPATGDRELRLGTTPGESDFQGVSVLPQVVGPVDRDGDGVADQLDVCPDVFDPGQEDFDGNRIGDACNEAEDPDGDEIATPLDNCPQAANPTQTDTDADGQGDACNDAVDRDGDDYRDDLDNCPDEPNDQIDRDGDGLGDPCDPFPLHFDNEKEQLRVDLAQALLDLESARGELQACRASDFFDDADADGEEDATDACPDTPAGAPVDADGCTQAQFCAALEAGAGLPGLLTCNRADWRGDEPETVNPQDCEAVGGGPSGWHCVAPSDSAVRPQRIRQIR